MRQDKDDGGSVLDGIDDGGDGVDVIGEGDVGEAEGWGGGWGGQ